MTAGSGEYLSRPDIRAWQRQRGYGPRGLELLRQGLSAKETLNRLQAEDTFEGKDGRQVAIINRNGGIAAYTGPKAQSWAGDAAGGDKRGQAIGFDVSSPQKRRT